MSEKLTAFERALLQQFEALAAVSESALNNSEDVSEVARAWQQHEGDFRSVGAETVRSRTEAEDADRSLRRANQAHRGLEGAIRELGKASERTADRTQEMTRERGQRDWDRAMKSIPRHGAIALCLAYL